ncbi:IS200/IS605 family transposase [Myxococcota bacterium]|nr:IS200/IS605 family transposase [Myxococcota bacterium]MBU1380546.1 IS200/IS605 family transposase [Myxococcota bacterium]MBU1497464.1 IS200/IS605 family transposase [Myxococcota bacterium]
MPQSYSSIYIHYIFSTQERKTFLKSGKVRSELYSYLKMLFAEFSCKVIEVGGTDDHIHILISASRETSSAYIMREIKSRSSVYLKTRIGLNEFKWQGGYGAFSVSFSEIDNVVRYIQNQEVHHLKYSYREELLLFLEKNMIEYDRGWFQ